MRTGLTLLCAVMLGVGCGSADLHAQADGGAKLEAAILDYTGASSTKHWTVVWVTTESGAFIKSLRKQGPSLTS